MWDKTIEKAINVEVKASRQPSSNIKKIDAWYLWSFRPIKSDKSIKLDTKDLKKTKSSHSFSTNLGDQSRYLLDQALG